MKLLCNRLIGLVFTAFTASCSGSPDAQGDAQTHASNTPARIAVRIGSGNTPVPPNTRLALLWELPFGFQDPTAANQTGYRRIASADAPLAPDGSAVLELTSAPPTYQPHEVEFVNSDIQIAEGVLIAYEDLNGNRALDMQSYDSKAYVDRIVAYNQDLRVLFASGVDASSAAQALNQRYGAPVRNGLGVHYLERDAASPSPFSASPAYETWDRFRELGYAYELTRAPTLSGEVNPADVDRLMCAEKPIAARDNWWWPRFSKGRRPFTYPKSEKYEDSETIVTCTEDGRWLEHRFCSTWIWGSNVCSLPSKDCTIEMWERPSPVPADWPCP